MGGTAGAADTRCRTLAGGSEVRAHALTHEMLGERDLPLKACPSELGVGGPNVVEAGEACL
jgi:hypothetical protein